MPGLADETPALNGDKTPSVNGAYILLGEMECKLIEVKYNIC